jgi:hypothetical protein
VVMQSVSDLNEKSDSKTVKDRKAIKLPGGTETGSRLESKATSSRLNKFD